MRLLLLWKQLEFCCCVRCTAAAELCPLHKPKDPNINICKIHLGNSGMDPRSLAITTCPREFYRRNIGAKPGDDHSIKGQVAVHPATVLRRSPSQIGNKAILDTKLRLCVMFTCEYEKTRVTVACDVLQQHCVRFTRRNSQYVYHPLGKTQALIRDPSRPQPALSSYSAQKWDSHSLEWPQAAEKKGP